MFTGLIETTGTVLSLARSTGAPKLAIALADSMAQRLTQGASIAVNGVCLTALDISVTANEFSGAHFSADLAAETLARTATGELQPGDIVNLELPTPAGAPLGGHIVQGHVDGVGRVIELSAVSPDSLATSDWALRVALPVALAAAIVPQGSIALDGISLTVAEIKIVSDTAEVRVAIIPHTYQATNLHMLRVGSAVNIELDILGKYAAQRAHLGAPAVLTVEYLLSNGY